MTAAKGDAPARVAEKPKFSRTVIRVINYALEERDELRAQLGKLDVGSDVPLIIKTIRNAEWFVEFLLYDPKRINLVLEEARSEISARLAITDQKLAMLGFVDDEPDLAGPALPLGGAA